MLRRGADILMRGAGRWAFRCILAFLAFLTFYAAAALVLGLIPVNTDFRQDRASVAVFIRGNGVHTDIIVPMLNAYHDWRGEFQTYDPTHSASLISFSWGDRGFYLQTPQWRDLRASVAFTALSGQGNALMRVEFAEPSAIGSSDAVLLLSETQYLHLVARIRDSFQRDSTNQPRLVATPLNPRGSYYFEAIGSYSLLHTCNDWTRRTLTAAGVRMPVWSPFYPAIFYQLRQIPAQQQ